MPKTRLEIFVCLVIVATLVALLWPAPPFTGGEARREICRNNLHAIALALHSYHDDYQCFPPAYVADADGRPMHSWRVLILPYLDQQELYERYDFAQPWDSPDNAKLAEEFPTPESFLCPSDRQAEAASRRNTSYLAVVGPHTCWPGSVPVSLAEITDDTAETLQVVESAGSGIHWMEPRELHMAQIAPTINPVAGQGIQSPHRVGAHALFSDGHVSFLSETLKSEQIQELLLRDDGELTPGFSREQLP